MHSFPTLNTHSHTDTVCVCVCVCALRPTNETLSEPQPVPLAMIMTTLSRAIERQQKKIAVCFPFTLWALRQKEQREKSEIKIWHFSGRGLDEVFYFSLVFSSTALLLAEYSHGDPEGRAAILVSCPAETISRRIRESKGKLLNMTQKYLSQPGGRPNNLCKRKKKKSGLKVLQSHMMHLWRYSCMVWGFMLLVCNAALPYIVFDANCTPLCVAFASLL